LKEFYLHLFYFIHGDNSEFSNFHDYLKRKIKIRIIDKIENYSDYLNQREKVEEQKRNFESELKFGEETENYNKAIQEYMESLNSRREKLINEALMKISSMQN